MRIEAQHGIVCRLPDEQFGYFGWPTVASLGDGRLFVASSGLRLGHICPFGKTVLNISADNGRSWSHPRVIQDSMIDDRDGGIISLPDGGLLVSWFRSDTRQYDDKNFAHYHLFSEAERDIWRETYNTWTDEAIEELLGSWVMLSDDAGETWGDPIKAPVSAPHGPIVLRNGDLLYMGKPYGTWSDMENGGITAARSRDGGHTWEMIGQVPLYEKTIPQNYCEPHVVELPCGRLIGMIRVHGKELDEARIPWSSMMQTESGDGGKTWSIPRPLGFHGMPPHLLRHSSGTLILSYGYRQKPFGQRVAFSHDEGATWQHDWILRDDGIDGDLGYPSTVELADGSLFSVYYQAAFKGEKCSLLCSAWDMPQLEMPVN